MNPKLYSLTIIISVLCFCQTSKAQTTEFVQQDIIKTAGVTADSMISKLSLANVQTTRVYFDGLGRQIQSVAVQASPNTNKDLIQIKQYNNLGQETIRYLPFVDNSATDTIGSFRSSAVSMQANYYQTNSSSTNKVISDQDPYSQRVFENSPLQRILQAGTEGVGFQPGQHYKSINYRSNNSTDHVIQWGMDGSYNSSNPYYAVNRLIVVDAKDEDGVEVLVFKDITDHIVLKRQISSPANLDTYYIYNTAGSLIYMVPPRAIALMTSSHSLTQTGVNKLIFQYVYDKLGRVIEKIVPGSAPLYIIYDPYNRPVLLQDGNLRNGNQWNYMKYDAKGHTISQGIYVNANAADTGLVNMQAYVNGIYGSNWFEYRSSASATGYYTNNSFPKTNFDGSALEALTYSYYDDYYLTQSAQPDYHYTVANLSGEENPVLFSKGLLTMIRKRSVGPGLNNIWLISVTFYDKHENIIQVQTNNQLNNPDGKTVTDFKTTVPDFMGKTLLTKVVKVTAYSSTNVITSYTYDGHNNRLASVSQSYNNGTSYTGIANYTYNELGQLVIKSLGKIGSTNNYLQNVDYRYNIHGQVLTINNSTLSNDPNTSTDTNDVFGMQYMYDQPDISSAKASFTGRVSEVKWIARNTGSNTISNERSYVYHYDKLNRIDSAIYADRPAGTNTWGNNDAFDEKNITYDENGNIKTLERTAVPYGTSTIYEVDNLTYTYSSTNPNQLATVIDGTSNSYYKQFGFKNPNNASGPYLYDPSSGNLTSDPYKGITLSYNELNRAKQITVTVSGNTITYTYDGTGAILRKQATIGTATMTTDYIDGFEYTFTAANPTLSFFPMPEGRVVFNSTNGTYAQQYIITDQQGNARVTFQDNGSGNAAVMQENSYYAYGLQMPTFFVTPSGTPNNNLFNGGAEWQQDLSGMPDFYQSFYRNYDPSLARWMSVDPKAESSESMSTYQYANLNPQAFNDPFGDKTAAEWNDIIGRLFNSQYGGKASDNGDVTFYSSEDEERASVVGSGGGGGGGEVYTVDINGNIKDKNVKTDGNYDLLISPTGSIKIPSGILELQQYAGNISYFYVDDDVVATKIFEFLAVHTNVEWSLIRFNTSGNLIGTGHNSGEDISNTFLLNLVWENYNYVRMDIHDHPYNQANVAGELFGPSGFRDDDTWTKKFGGDKYFAREYDDPLRNWNFAPIVFEVYDVTSNYYFQYNGFQILNDISKEQYMEMYYNNPKPVGGIVVRAH